MNAGYKTYNNKRSKVKIFITIFYFFVTGLITIPLTTWFAAGTIAESQTDSSYPAPEFFWLIAIWILGLVIAFLPKLYWLGIIISFLPVAYFIYLFVPPSFM